LYVSLFLVDLMSEHTQVFNDNEFPSTIDNRVALLSAFERARSAIANKSLHCIG
jgi:hypothetical protein